MLLQEERIVYLGLVPLTGIAQDSHDGLAGAQVAGGLAGAMVANLMYSLPAVELSTTSRTGSGRWLAEVVATFGLVLLVRSLIGSDRTTVAPDRRTPTSYVG